MSIALLVPIYAGLLAVNLIYTFVLWFRTREKLYKVQVQAFIFFGITLFLQGASAESDYIWRAITASTTFFGLTALSRVMSLIIRQKSFPFIKYLIIYLSGLAVTVAMYFLNIDPNIMALPGLIGASFPVFATAYDILFVDKHEPSFITKCFIGAGVFYGLHMLDYAFVMDKPEFMYVGFLVAVLAIFAFMMFANAAVVETIMFENAYYKMQMQYRVMLTNSSKLASLGEMAGGMAHEINNPLAVIQLQSDILKKTLSGKELERLGVVSDALHRISKVITNLRHFSRDTSNDPLTEASAKDIIDQTLSFCKARFADQGIQIDFQMPQDFKIKCRPVQLAQSMLNLLNNSFESLVKKHGGGKTITIRGEKSPTHALIRIIDNGVGVPAEIKNRIFDPFFTTKDIGEGMGLGLSVSLGMIEAQNGTLELETGNEKTCFLIKMPLA